MAGESPAGHFQFVRQRLMTVRLVQLMVLFAAAPSLWGQVRLRPTAAECASIIQVAESSLDQPVQDSVKVLTSSLPPAYPPRDARGRPVLVQFVVDTSGRAVLETLLMTGSKDSTYYRQLQKSLSQWRFRPARLGFCAVPHHYHFTLTVQ